MEPQDQDFSAIPLEQRLVHKVWKARLGAYEELIKEFSNSPSEHDEIFSRFDINTLKNIVIDLNVVAQETGILSISKYLEFGPAKNAIRLQKAGIVSSLCEKGLSSSRAGTKLKTNEVILLLVENVTDANVIIEDMIPSLKHRLPKLVAGVVNSMYQMIENFGCSIINPNPIISVLPTLFSHADRNVRNETTKLTVELYKWMRDSLKIMLLDDLKPIQKKDLEKAFDQVHDETPQQNRLTRSQKEAQQQQQQQNNNNGNMVNAIQGDDVEMEDTEAIKLQVDPFDLLQPVEVLSKLPPDFHQRINNPVWKERKEVLEEVYAILSKAVKLNPKDDFLDIMRIFTKNMKDANMQVVQLSSQCVACLAKGLRNNFRKYYSMILVPMLERNKEKKPSFTEAINQSLDSIFKSTSLSDILEGTLATMTHKTPAVKISAINYLTRCLSETDVPPSSSEIDIIMNQAVKLLSESQEPIRQASSQLIGTLMKITSERQLIRYLEKVDDNRKNKINKFFESAEVKCNLNKPSVQPRPSANTNNNNNNTNGSANTMVPPTKVIPSKRMASSPAKRTDTKVSNFSRSLTGRSLTSDNSTIPKLQQPQPSQQFQPPMQKEMEVDNSLLEELKLLKLKNKELETLNIQLNKTIEQLKLENKELSSTLEKANNNANLMVKQKDAQLSRINSEKENMILKIKDLEQTIEIMKLNQKTNEQQQHQYQSQHLQPSSRPISPYKREERITSGELSSRVDRLSIDNMQSDNKHGGLETPTYQRPEYREFDNSDDSWKKAAEITNQLRARIEKMKARTRTPNFT